MPSPTAPGGFVVRLQSAAAPPVASSVARDRIGAAIGHDAEAAVTRTPKLLHALTFGDLDPRVGEHALDEHSRDPVTGRGAARVDDASPTVAAFEPEVVVELDAELDEVANPRRRLSGERCDGLGRERPRPVRKVSSAWSAGESSSPSAAAIPPCASELVDRRSGPLASTRTRPSDAAQSAAYKPATPAPTTTRSNS